MTHLFIKKLTNATTYKMQKNQKNRTEKQYELVVKAINREC